MIEKIHTEQAPQAIGPYSQAIRAGDFLFISGQIAMDPETGEVAQGIEAQTRQVMANMQAILTEAQTDFDEVVKFTIYIKSMDDFATVNDIYGNYLTEPYPARTTIEIAKLPKDALVEMDAIVYAKSRN